MSLPSLATQIPQTSLSISQPIRIILLCLNPDAGAPVLDIFQLSYLPFHAVPKWLEKSKKVGHLPCVSLNALKKENTFEK